MLVSAPKRIDVYVFERKSRVTDISHRSAALGKMDLWLWRRGFIM